VAEDNFVVAPDGLVAACFGANHRGSAHCQEYAIGEVSPTTSKVCIDEERVERARSYAVANIPRCRGCFAKWHCSGGCRLFHTPPFCAEAPHPMCWVTQKLTLWQILEQLTLFDHANRVGLEAEEVAYG
jgi:radical SAM protein with 4Fe4S-binding SPASM domain